ncbi:glyoxalase superfamily protein [Paucibacter sp. PLA-PC-4]|uniref:glyoxalase superfamily protein n=1 Tax=Paucibacter sp. PLA-PC-4 TaxID=2993655 RepID=UPI002248D82C|nr:glyoxalase superfamily protein [Paucibacter sp. PLA-PC-4]MCX2860800.1 glyoxalase superfamily protein [Paucibacter sp. PLA-PC-4]
MSFGKATPILRIFDESKARAFYVDFLGFTIDWEHRFADGLPLYLQLSKGDCLLHLSEHHGDCSPGAKLRIPTDELDAYQQQLITSGYAYMRPGIETQPWAREMTVIDPFGNRLVFFMTSDAD